MIKSYAYNWLNFEVNWLNFEVMLIWKLTNFSAINPISYSKMKIEVRDALVSLCFLLSNGIT